MSEPLATLPAPSASASVFTLSIHEEVGVVLASLKSPQGPGNGNPDKLQQAVLKDEGGASPSTSKTIVHWSFVEQNKEYNLLLCLKEEERQNDGEIIISVESVHEEEGLDLPAPTVAKTFRLLVKGGTITLRSLPFGQTSFTFTAQFVGIDNSDASEGEPRQGMISAVKKGVKKDLKAKFRVALKESQEEKKLENQLVALQKKLAQEEERRMQAEQRAKDAEQREPQLTLSPPPPRPPRQSVDSDEIEERLKDNNRRLMDANAAAGASFAALNQHSKQLSKNNGKYQQDLSAAKSREQARATQIIELKEELKMQKATYIAEVHSRLQYSKILSVIARTVEDRSDDAHLVDEVNAIVEDCESSYMTGPNGMTLDISKMKTPGRKKKKRRSLGMALGLIASPSPQKEGEMEENGVEALMGNIGKGLRSIFGGGEENHDPQPRGLGRERGGVVAGGGGGRGRGASSESGSGEDFTLHPFNEP
ncbi:hypothetical protein TrST_g1244 [Triparma strigata]|uniref:Uncharacterized protein n=1 Tax=Triparma strigata TaxID=1606541 RepID=A0A9W7BWP7_9STRA|nr:hypothetical protein TrST_g1244 [Triparma strigata]